MLVSDLKLDSIENPRVDDLLELEYSDFNSFYIQGAFFRKDIIDKIGGFDEDMTGDDIVLRTKVFRYLKEHSEYGYEIIKEPICYYRQHNENISGNSVRQIKIVTEYLQRYWADRENPDVLVTWALHAIKNLKFEESIGLFSMNTRAALLLANNKIQKALMKKARRETSILRHIYYKTKEKNKRTITIFSFFKISYTKKDSYFILESLSLLHITKKGYFFKYPRFFIIMDLKKIPQGWGIFFAGLLRVRIFLEAQRNKPAGGRKRGNFQVLWAIQHGSRSWRIPRLLLSDVQRFCPQLKNQAKPDSVLHGLFQSFRPSQTARRFW